MTTPNSALTLLARRAVAGIFAALVAAAALFAPGVANAAVPDGQVSIPDNYTVPAGGSITVNILDNDIKPEGTLFDFFMTDSDFVTDPSGSNTLSYLAVNSNGSVYYQPHAGFIGTETFWYSLDSDSRLGDRDTAVTFTVVAPPNNAPVAVADTATMHAGDSAIENVLVNDYDPDGDEFTVRVTSAPLHGELFFNFFDVPGRYWYTPDIAAGEDSFTYEITDPFGATSSTTVTLTVLAYLPPVATPDVFDGVEDTQITGSVLANDTGLPALTVSEGQIITPAGFLGSVSLQRDGTFVYNPAPDFNGTETFYYTTADRRGNTSNQTTITVNVARVNDAPVAKDDLLILDEDNYGTVNILANDSDVDGDGLIVDVLSRPAHGFISYESNGVYTYAPSANFHGTDSFTYAAEDSSGTYSEVVTVSITVNPVNDAPVGGADTFTVDEDAVLTGAVLGNDIDADGDNLTVGSHTEPGHGVLVLGDDGTFTYTPGAGFSGTDSFTYTASDGATALLASEPITVTITVVAADDPAVPGEGSGSGGSGATATTIDQLPSTGSDLSGQPLWPLALLMVGAALLIIRKRRAHARPQPMMY